MPRASRTLETGAAALLFAAGTALTIHAGYFRMFSFFASWDDEGYMLVSLRSFRALGALYTDVYSQYGPLYFLVMDLLFGGLGLPVTHDTGRLVTLGLWAATSLVEGVVAWRLTRSVGLGLCVQLLVFRSLFVQHFEPMHPGGLLCLLLACLSALPLLDASRPRLGAAVLGVLVAALALVKINVGTFALLAAAFFYVASPGVSSRRRVLLIGTGLALAAAPFALMWPALNQPWALRYALHAAAAAAAVALAVGSLGSDERFRPVQLGWCAAGLTGLALVVGGDVLLLGTTPGDLFEALLVRPLGQAAALTIPMRLPPGSANGALVAFGLCVAAVASRRSGRWRGAGADLLEGSLRMAAGLAMALTASGWSLATGSFTSATPGFVMAPLAWLAALEPREMESSPALAIARRLLPPLAVLQTLHAYPVAGLSQVQWSSFLLIPLGAIALADGARQLARAATPLRLSTPGWPRRLAGASAVLLLLAVTLRGVHIHLRQERGLYERNVPLGLPGAARLRVPAAEADTLRLVVADLRRDCSTHVSLPGLNSFYLWAEQEPPTAANTTSWMYLFDASVQGRIVDRLRGIDRLCGVRSADLAAVFTRGRAMPPGPLLDYFAGAFRPAAQHGPFTVLVRR
jgi:hypothetical protein